MDIDLILIIAEFAIIVVDLVLLVFLIVHVDRLRNCTIRLEKSVEEYDHHLSDLIDKLPDSKK